MFGAPVYDVDYYGDEFIADPLPHYAAMRALGPVVYLPQHGQYAAVGFDALREAMRQDDVFISGKGVAGDDFGCNFTQGNTMASDGAAHIAFRKVSAAPLLRSALQQHRERIDDTARALVDDLCLRRSVDAVKDVAQHLPLKVVTYLVGLPEDGRENMLEWGAGTFDMLGVQNERGRTGFETNKQMREWVRTRATPDRLLPGSWSASLYEKAARGEIDEAVASMVMRDYIAPSLDTTIAATGELLYQLGRNPEQWALVREDPRNIPAAVEEGVRLGTPIRSFTRYVSRDYNLAGVDLPSGSRLILVFASANRDPAHFPNPDKFDVQRRPLDHVSFGHGAHICAGMHLARMEMIALLTAMARRIEKFEVGEPTLAFNNTIHAYATLPMTITAVAGEDAGKVLQPSV